MKSRDIKVSVIIPVFNVEKYLEQCIDSVLTQTLRQIEIICVDDGSTDQSLEILKKYAKKDSRITVYTKPNAGYGHTINYGLERSHGKYISIVESDDFIDENGIELLYNCAEMNGADYVRSNYYQLSNGKNYPSKLLDTFMYDKILSSAKKPSLFFRMPCTPWGCIYNRVFLDKNNIRMNETPGASYQDSSWTFIVLLKAERIVFIKDMFYHYRVDNENSSINSRKKIFCVVDEKNYMVKKMIEYQISDRNVFESFSRLIYENYRWNYNRVSREFQYAFLLEWRKEILKQLSDGFLRKECFEESQWEEIDNIICNVDNYFEETAKEYLMRGVYSNTINKDLYYEAFVKTIVHNNVIIFGTGGVAKEVVYLLEEMGAKDNIICFLETEPQKLFFFGKPIFSIQDFPYSKSILLVCAVMEKTQKKVVKNLKETGFSNILSIDEIIRAKMINS